MNNNRHLIEQYFASLTGQSDTPISNYFADDIVWHLPPAHPFGGPFIGLNAVLDMLGQGSHLFRFETIAIDRRALIVEGDNAAVHFILNAKMHDNRDYSNEYLFRFQCQDGKISQVWECMDTYYQYTVGMFDMSE